MKKNIKPTKDRKIAETVASVADNSDKRTLLLFEEIFSKR